MNPLDPDADRPQDIIACYLVINAELEMSPGKTAAQAFQAHQRLHAAYQAGQGTADQRALYETWQATGTRTITKFAPTRGLFARAADELDGALMVDEGLTEVEPDSPTVLATWPIRRSELPRMLRHKRLKLEPPAPSRQLKAVA